MKDADYIVELGPGGGLAGGGCAAADRNRAAGDSPAHAGRITFCLPVEDAHMSGNAAVCTVRKDAGDDPDITNGVRITLPCAESKRALP